MFPSRPPPTECSKKVERLRRRNNKSVAPLQPTPITLYRPSIYSYMCRGAYHASSDAKEGSEGVCNGFKSQLEILYEERQEMLSRAEALKRFTTMTADYDFDEDFQHEDTGEYGGGLSEQAQAVLISPALIYKDKDAAVNNKAPIPEKPPVVNPILNSAENTLPEEDLIKRQEWSCYGSTEVEYLVLQDVTTGEKKIAAVAPRNTGVSRRTIETDDSIRSITRIGLGVLDIIHDNNSIIDRSSSHPSGNDQSNDNDNMHSSSSSPLPEEVPPRPPYDAIATVKENLQRTYEFSHKVAEHMKLNVQWLSENLRDDFPNRTYQAGREIIHRVPHTMEQTAASMGKIMSFLLGDDDDDDDDNDGHRRR